MDADAASIVQHLRSVVIYLLDTFNLRSAEFACERLAAMAPDDPDVVFLYALTLFRQGKYKGAYNRTAVALDTMGDHLGCAYVYARLCVELQLYKEGVFRLVNMAHLYNEAAHDSGQDAFFFSLPAQRSGYEGARSIYPDASAVYHLLADLYKAQGDTKNAVLNYQQALRYNIFDFEAFQELARSGAEVSVKALYTPKLLPQESILQAPVLPFAHALPPNGDADTPFDSLGVPNPFATRLRHKSAALELSTPRVASVSVPDAPLRRTHGHNAPATLAPIPKFDHKTPTAARSLSYVRERLDYPESGRSHLKRSSSLGLVPTIKEQHSAKDAAAADAYLRRLYSVFAKLFKCFCKYDCYKAIRILGLLPENEQDTPWVLSKLGRLHYEIVNYKQSKRYFVRLRQLDRTRLEDMEYYSTLLWHLHKKVELTYLSNELHDIDSTLAITWCVLGNLFSLNREPDEAIRCFNKSIALDQSFTYAHTLKGHEYFGNDNYERALDCFRYSLLLDPRHYNAYYGIGMVYINLGEYQKADYHFRKAVLINPINIILICCVGMVLEKIGKKTLALRQYELANKLQPLSALPIFKKAQLLFAMQQFPQALKQFEMVKELAPNEASVHFLLGQLYNIQNEKYQAIREFTIALNLDPKGNYLIREAMEMLKDS